MSQERPRSQEPTTAKDPKDKGPRAKNSHGVKSQEHPRTQDPQEAKDHRAKKGPGPEELRTAKGPKNKGPGGGVGLGVILGLLDD